jgi:hypothetical protein
LKAEYSLSTLQAAKRAAQVRKEVLESFDLDNLVDVFSLVEFFVSNFPGDGNITKRSINLTVAILEAIERAIAFFHGNACKNPQKVHRKYTAILTLFSQSQESIQGSRQWGRLCEGPQR